MKIGGTQILLAIVLAIIAGCIGAFAASEWRDSRQQQGLHAFVHDELELGVAQHDQLDQLEADFAIERQRLELSLRAANAQLATAMEEEHEYGPKVAAAIDEVHTRMGDLQKATVSHVFAMRGLLDAEQQVQFDRQVAASLTGDTGE